MARYYKNYRYYAVNIYSHVIMDYIFYLFTYNLLKDVFFNFYYENTLYIWYLYMELYINNIVVLKLVV
ncbi:hypothetical protein SZ47_01795 [Brachyspira hyodysenteriae]|nr:hypothetical protein SU46_10450 [Brachyspira hyodysenteriae]KLI17278.1 hypothetical protein SU45_05795 [Brachyspira hyodysenteriae]KLI27096.1 hypothetical protein SR30_03265 [Brachyspira hyodysenteriae]KLI28682.1 hypothetical protein SZ47_01795 [Brachyspira hyodysenteriae]KLI30398.1 hypothetical protein SZ49_06420 [Brachyspira hyodysenteriae]